MTTLYDDWRLRYKTGDVAIGYKRFNRIYTYFIQNKRR